MSDSISSDIDIQVKAGVAPSGEGAGIEAVAATSAETPDYLIPKMRQYAIGETTQYQTVHITNIETGEAKAEITSALDPFAAEEPLLGSTPAEGVLLTHQQGWKQLGLALGELLHSLCLAPGEATRIAVIDWRRQVRSSGEEDIAEEERLSREAEQNRAISEVQKAVAAEHQSGRSLTRASASARQRGASGSLFGLFGGSSGRASNLSSSSSVSFSAGKRELTSQANQKIHQRTREVAAAVRSRRASVVREIDERESETVTTRVVANYNHMHALTVMYFELLQVFSLVTEVVKAERLIFLPMQLVAFDAKTIKRHRETLIEIATDFELEDLRKLLLLHGDPEAERTREAVIVDLEKKVVWLKNKISNIEQEIKKLSDENRLAGQKFEQVKKEIDELEKISEKTKEIEEKFIMKEREFSILLTKIFDLPEEIKQKNGELLKFENKISEIESLILIEKQDRLAAALNREQLFFNQQLWMRLDDHQVYGMIAKHSHDDQSLVGRLDPRPLAVFGNYLGFRFRFGDGDTEVTAQAEFEKDYLTGGQAESRSSTIALPSGGIFAEAVLGEAIGAEEIDLNRFWNWADSPIPILPPEIAAVATGSRAAASEATPGQLGTPAAQLQGAGALPDPTGSATLLQMLAAGQLFRDMSGLAGGQTAAGEAGSGAGQGASDAAGQANAANKAYLDFVQGLAETGGKLLTANNSTVLGGLLKLNKTSAAKPDKGDGGA